RCHDLRCGCRGGRTYGAEQHESLLLLLLVRRQPWIRLEVLHLPLTRLGLFREFVLVGLANHAGPDGTGAFPSVATLVRYTGLAERTVRTCLDRLEAGDIISPCDPDIVVARIKRAGRRPQ